MDETKPVEDGGGGYVVLIWSPIAYSAEWLWWVCGSLWGWTSLAWGKVWQWCKNMDVETTFKNPEWWALIASGLLAALILHACLRRCFSRPSYAKPATDGESMSKRQRVINFGKQAARLIRPRKVAGFLTRNNSVPNDISRLASGSSNSSQIISPMPAKKRKKRINWNIGLAKTILQQRRNTEATILRPKEPPPSFLEAGWEDVATGDTGLQSEIIMVLKTCRVFGYFEEPVFLELCKYVKTMPLAKGEMLFRVGDEDNSIFVVSKGALELYIRDRDGNTVPIDTITTGQSAGSLVSILDVISGRSSTFKTVEARALEDTVVLRLPIKEAMPIFDKYPRALTKVIRMILVRLQRITLLILYKYLGLTKELFRLDPPPLHPDHLFTEKPKDTPPAPAAKGFFVGGEEGFGDGDGEGSEWEEKVLEALAAGVGVEEGKAFLADNVVFETIPPHTHGRLQAVVRPVVETGSGQPTHDDVVMHVGPGGCIGQMSLLTALPAFYGIQTGDQPAKVARLSAASFERFLELYPKALLAFAQEVAGSLAPLARQADFGVDWMQVNAGKAIYRQGANSDSICIVLNGRLRSVVTLDGGRKEFIDEFGRGESVGELELLTATKRVTSVHAVRDTELAKLPAPLFEMLRQYHPKIAINFTRRLGQRLMNSFQAGPRPRKEGDSLSTHKNLSTIAVVALSNDVPLRSFCIKLTNALNAIGTALHLTHELVEHALGDEVFMPTHEYKLISWLGEQEESHRIVIYETDKGTTPWTQRCVKQADCILVVGLGASEPRLGRVEQDLETITNRAQKELVLLHSPDARPMKTAEWLNLRNWCTAHHHIRCSQKMLNGSEVVDYGQVSSPQSDFSRLARRLTNTSVGLVLGGGGARGISHLGIIRALQERGIPIDMVGGTSIGAFIGGLYADETDIKPTIERAAEFSKGMASMWNKALDLTYPITAMFSGSGFNNGIREAFETRQIEDLWLPYFCVTTDLTDSKMKVHRHGSMWRYIRASMTLAGYLPPLCDPEDGHLLVDGGYTNNLPADIMKEMGAQTIIAVDVSSKDEKDFSNFGDELSGWWLLWKRWNPFATPVKVPDMAEIQSRLAYVSCVRQLEDVLSRGMCEYIRPPIDKYSTLQFGSFDEIEAVGYTHAKGVLAQWAQTHQMPSLLKERAVSMLDLVPDDQPGDKPQQVSTVPDIILSPAAVAGDIVQSTKL